jgi:hypothetical protein
VSIHKKPLKGVRVMGAFSIVNLLIDLIILSLVGFLIYKVAKKVQHTVSSSQKIKDLEKRVSKIEEEK